MSFRDLPLRYDMSGGSVKISLSCLWAKPGGIALQRAIFLYGIPVRLFKSVTIFYHWIWLQGGVSLQHWLGILYSEGVSRCFSYFPQQFVLRSLNASPLIKRFQFCGAWWMTRVKIFSRFEVCLHVKDRFFVKSYTFVHFRDQECPSLCMFVSNRYFKNEVYFIPWFRVHLKHCSSDHNTSRDLEFDKNVPRLITTGATNLKKK